MEGLLNMLTFHFFVSAGAVVGKHALWETHLMLRCISSISGVVPLQELHQYLLLNPSLTEEEQSKAVSLWKSPSYTK